MQDSHGKLMQKQKSLKNIRQEFKNAGIFYTPPALAEKLKSYVNIEPHSVYDPTCGAGNLLKVFPDKAEKYGQELDVEQLKLVDLPNFHGYAGDTLLDDGFAGQKFDCIVANPPFSVRWQPDALASDPRFAACPVMPPPSKADWAFLLHILYHLADDGVAVSICAPGILYRGQREGKIRRWFVENNYIDRVVNIPGKTFEDTDIATAIIVLRKNRQNTNITFEDGERVRTATQKEVAEFDYRLSVSAYLPEEMQEEEIDILAVNKQVVDTTISSVDKTFEMLLTIQELMPKENLYIMELYTGLQDVLQKHKQSVWQAELEGEAHEQQTARD